MLPVFSCCLSFSPFFVSVIHKAEINPSPIHDIHLNTGTEGRCDIITADVSSENVPLACHFSVDSSAFPGGFRTSLVRDGEVNAQGLTVGTRRQSLSLVKMLRDHGVCVAAKESSTKGVWIKPTEQELGEKFDVQFTALTNDNNYNCP
jgi:hypothetical protein